MKQKERSIEFDILKSLACPVLPVNILTSQWDDAGPVKIQSVSCAGWWCCSFLCT